MTVLIAGGGISGLALALTCHQIGVPCKVFESVAKLRPLGVGINLQSSAVRELYDMGLAHRLDEIGIRTRDYGMYSKKGLHIWTEDRGTWAGYTWPQYSIHRGQLHMMLYDALLDRTGPDVIETGWSVVGFSNQDNQAHLHLRIATGETRTETGCLVIGADGIHSTIRAQLVPEEGPPVWGGTMLWRGTTQAKPYKSGASMVMIGHDGLRIVSYPISKPDSQTGAATLNWIATLNYDKEASWRKEDWSREANLDDFLPQFEGMVFDWLDVPQMIRNSERIYEYPMVDRDPLDQWTHGRVTLMGDAAHAAYPVGSNGAGSGIIDARELGAAFLAHGVTPAALTAYEAKMRPVTSEVILTNRVAGPDKILDIVEERCGGQFDKIEDIISQQEMLEHANTYKAIAGYGIQSTNEKARTIPENARVTA